MVTPKIILSDVDEVLFDWAEPFEAWVRATYPQYRDVKTHLVDHWHVEAWLGCEIEESRRMIREFNGDPTIWPYFKPLEHVVESVKQLHDLGYQFVAITACAEDQATYEGRWQNLQDVFGYGVFDTLHCVGLASSKREALARYKPTIWVEDKFKHAFDGVNLGHTSFLINYNHNIRDHDDRIIRVDDWRAIVNHVLELEDANLNKG